MEEILKDIKEQIKNFDYKASIMIGISGIIFGFSFNFVGFINQHSESLLLEIFILILIGFFYGLISIIIFCLIKVIIPRGKKKTNESYDAIYYYDIATHSEDEFYSNIDAQIKDTGVFKRQIVECSKVAKSKHDYLKTAMFLFMPLIIVSVVFLMLEVIISG